VTNPELQHTHQRLKWFVIPIIPTPTALTTKDENKQKQKYPQSNAQTFHF
jgi:hypothetical protein